MYTTAAHWFSLKMTQLTPRLFRYYKLAIGSRNVHLNYQQLKHCFATCHWVDTITNNVYLMFSAAWCILQSDMIKHHESPPFIQAVRALTVRIKENLLLG